MFRSGSSVAPEQQKSEFAGINDIGSPAVVGKPTPASLDADLSDTDTIPALREGTTYLLRRLSTRKSVWVITTLLAATMCYALARPQGCKEVSSCVQQHQSIADLSLYSGLLAAALASVLMHELAAVILTHRTAKKAMHLIPNIRESLLPSALLCTTFFVLLIENLILVIGDVPWFAHAANLGDADLDQEPVYTVFYAEWLINVPILLVLAGSIALVRPIEEVAEPLIVTNVYIVFAWVAHFISNAPLRYIVVAVAFLMYFRASWTMCLWVKRWRADHPEGHLLGRPVLSFALIVVFGIYGLVYLARLHGIVNFREERLFFVIMDSATKLCASMILAGIRASEFQEVLLSMLANTQTSFKRACNYEDECQTLLADK